MLHGVSVPNYVFVQAANALTKSGYRVLLFDHFGHGFSDRPSASYDADFFDREMLEFLNALELKAPLNIAALSMGGIIAAEFTARHPERVKSLTLFAPAGLRLVNESDTTFAKILKSPFVGHWLWRIVARRIYFPPEDNNVVKKDRESDEILHGDPERQADYAGYFAAMRQIYRNLPLGRRDEVFAAIGDASVPVLGIFGDADETVSIDSADILVELIPEARIEILEGATHHLNLHRWSDIHDIMMSFLRDNNEI